MRDRFMGCLLGLAVGDALGAPVEGMSRGEIAALYGRLTEMVGGGWLGLRPGQWTDDTAMALCIARSIVEKGGFEPEDVAQRFVAWLDSGPVDIGRTTWVALREIKGGAPWHQASRIAHEKLAGLSAGNGSIMRCAPVGLLHFRHRDRLIRDSLDSSLITHWDPRATWGAVAVNLAIAELLEDRREGLLSRLGPAVDQPEVRQAVAEVEALTQNKVRTSGYVLDTLQAALWCFLNTPTFEEALVTAVNLGGDADTVGAVCGALAGAYYGLSAIPLRWLGPLQGREELEALAEGIHELALGEG